jgi:hypothetical protein
MARSMNHPVQEVEHVLRDFIAIFLQRKMAGFKEMNLGARHVTFEGPGAGRAEDRIVLSPDGEEWRVEFTSCQRR